MLAWLGSFISQEKLVSYKKDPTCQENGFEAVLKHSSLGEEMLQKNIGCTTLWSLDSFMADWFRARHIQVIAPELALSQQLGNKINFDRFLAQSDLPRPKSWIISSLAELADLKGRLVIQEPVSSGSEGTFFVSGQQDVAALVQASKLKEHEPYLVRKFVDGTSYGITLFIGRTRLVLSLPRIQLFYQSSDAQRVFAGIQWDSKMDAAGRSAINQVFGRLGKILHQLGYFGYASFDFILQDNRVFLIECNPRFSQSTAHVFSNPLVTGGIETLPLFVDGFFQPPESGPEFTGLPDGSFAGCDINLRKENMPRLPNGVYRMDPAGFSYLGPDILKFSPHPQEFMLTGWFVDPAQQDEVGSITANFPLFENESELNETGQRLLNHVTAGR